MNIGYRFVSDIEITNIVSKTTWGWALPLALVTALKPSYAAIPRHRRIS